MSWRCHDTDVAAPWQSCGNVKAVLWQCCSIAMAALQHCHGSTSMAVRTLLNSTLGPSSQHYTVIPLHHFVHGVPSQHYTNYTILRTADCRTIRPLLVRHCENSVIFASILITLRACGMPFAVLFARLVCQGHVFDDLGALVSRQDASKDK